MQIFVILEVSAQDFQWRKENIKFEDSVFFYFRTIELTIQKYSTNICYPLSSLIGCIGVSISTFNIRQNHTIYPYIIYHAGNPDMHDETG